MIMKRMRKKRMRIRRILYLKISRWMLKILICFVRKKLLIFNPLLISRLKKMNYNIYLKIIVNNVKMLSFK